MKTITTIWQALALVAAISLAVNNARADAANKNTTYRDGNGRTTSTTTKNNFGGWPLRDNSTGTATNACGILTICSRRRH